MAKELGVSVITTTRAYNELESEGFISSVQGKGSIVRKRDNSMIREQYLKKIEQGLETAIATAALIDMPEEELRSMFEILIKER